MAAIIQAVIFYCWNFVCRKMWDYLLTNIIFECIMKLASHEVYFISERGIV